MLERSRSLLAVFIALTLIVAGAAQVVQASDMTVRMSAAISAGDIPMPDGCSGCGNDEGMPMACFAVCAGSMNAILPSAPLVIPGVLIGQTAPFVSAAVDYRGPPDPYPPRPVILS